MINPFTRLSSALPWTALLLVSCIPDRNAPDTGPGAAASATPDGGAGGRFDEAGLRERGLLSEADWKPVYLGPPTDPGATAALGKAAAAATRLSFQDPDALARIPDVNGTFVLSPGYRQSMDLSRTASVWMSYGPGTGLIPPSDAGPYFRIIWKSLCVRDDSTFGVYAGGRCQPVPDVLERFHQSRYGTDYLAVTVSRARVGRVSFNVTGITVVAGSVPVHLYYQDARGKWIYLPDVGPGKWGLQMSGIRELQITASSRERFEHYSVDDIDVSY